MDKKILEIHVENQSAFFLINVAVKTEDGKFTAYFGKFPTLTEYTINRTVEAGKRHVMEIGSAMFPNLSQDLEYDELTELLDKDEENIKRIDCMVDEGRETLVLIQDSNPELELRLSKIEKLLKVMRDMLVTGISKRPW